MDRLEAMRAYRRVVELGSFTQAARELGVKQSTVSKWIATLEEELQVELVQRSTRSQRVTEAGERFYGRAGELLALYDETRAELDARRGALAGRLRLSLPVVIGARLLVPPLLDFATRHPGLELELSLDDRYVDLREGGFDLAIRIGTPRDSTLHAITLGRAPRLLIASPDYLSRRGTPHTPEALQDHTALQHTLNAATNWALTDASGATTRVRPARALLASDNSEVLMEMARRGMGIATLVSWIVEEDLRQGRLVALLPEHTLPEAILQALSPSPELPRRAEALLTHLRAHLAQTRARAT